MADKKISAMTALTGANAVGTDVIPILDLSEADASKNKKISLDELKKQGTIFTDLSGTAWDGTYRTKTLTANTALTFSSTLKSGMLIVTQDATGSRTLSINGTSITINTAANSKSSISFIYDEVNAVYVFFFDLNLTTVGGGGITELDEPTSFLLTAASSTQLNATWGDIANESSYTVELYSDAGFTTLVSSASKAAGSTSHSFTGLTASTTYYGRIKSVGDGVTYSDSSYVTDSEATSAGGATIAGTAWSSYFDMSSAEKELRVAGDTFVAKIWDQMDSALPQYPTSNDKVMRQVTEANQPKYLASGINGLPSIEFDTTAKWLETVSVGAINKPLTRIAVVQLKSLPAAYRYFLYNRSAAARADIGHDDTGKLYMHGGTGVVGTTTLVVDTKYLLWAEFQTDGTSRLFLNGTLEIGPTSVGADAQLYHGRLGTDAGTSANMWMGDAFVYAGIFSDADRATLTTELKTKYGIA